jgi:GNAT superfamily N-acetyltransferase
MSTAITIRPLRPEDRAEWEVLWKGYQVFYKTDIPVEVTDLTWQRFHDPTEPMHALGAFAEGRLEGIVHYIFHRSCWTRGDYCYLQDLFTREGNRGRGIGRKLIEAVKTAALAAGASRVHWLTHETNAEAMVLYNRVAERSGFLQYRIRL